MRVATLAGEDDFEGWRSAARALALGRVPPAEIVWQVGATPGDLFEAEPPAGAAFNVPRAFVELARTAILHADPERFGLLYALLVRLLAQPRTIDDHADPLVARLEEMAKAVRHDVHRMRAGLHFREAAAGGLAAWFVPEHHIVRADADFYLRRFAERPWSILTPLLCAHWNGAALTFTPGVPEADAAALMPALPADAQARETDMAATAEIGGNTRVAWEALRDEAAGCTRCPLYKPATQTVFGEGRVDASLMFVGEQPGDQEDLTGRPFVGPAGQVFDRALAAAGIDRATTYVTNAVKHFKFEPRGRRRIHAKPGGPEIDACRWWIEQERVLIRPPVTVALGATAARSLLGKVVTISGTRGRAQTLADGGEAWVTVHPSYLLRLQDKVQADEEYARFVEDLKVVKARAAALGAA